MSPDFKAVAATLVAFAAVLSPFAARAEKTNVCYIHVANVNERNACAWESEMFKRLWLVGANLEDVRAW